MTKEQVRLALSVLGLRERIIFLLAVLVDAAVRNSCAALGKR